MLLKQEYNTRMQIQNYHINQQNTPIGSVSDSTSLRKTDHRGEKAAEENYKQFPSLLSAAWRVP